MQNKKNLSEIIREKVVLPGCVVAVVGLTGVQIWAIHHEYSTVRKADVYVDHREFFGNCYEAGGFYDGKKDLQRIKVLTSGPPMPLGGPDLNSWEIKRGEPDFPRYETALLKEGKAKSKD